MGGMGLIFTPVLVRRPPVLSGPMTSTSWTHRSPEHQNNPDQPEHSQNSITFANLITCSPFCSSRYSNLIIYILTNCIDFLDCCYVY